MSRGLAASHSNHDRTYRPDIDGLRAIAVLSVVFFHANFAEVSGGFVGVDIFFVISGYLITGIIARELENGHFSFSNFYSRRIKRICPALFVVLGLSALAGFFLLVPSDLRTFGRSIVAAVLFYSNWLFYNEVDYFDGPAIEKPLLHTWSLAIEEQFYLIWPVAIFCLYKAFGRKVLPYLILAILCLSLAASQIVIGRDQASVFYLLPYRAWELLLGAYIAVAPFAVRSRRVASLLGVAGFAAIAYAAFSFDIKTPFPGLNALFPCIGAAILISAGMQRQAFSHRVLSLGPLRFVGKISYSLYLIHWPLFSFAHLAFDRPLTMGERATILAVSFILAALSYWFVETPARRTNFRFSVLAPAAASAALLLTLSGVAFHAGNGFPARVPPSVQLAISARQTGSDGDRADCRADPRPASLGRACPVGAAAPDMQYDFVVWGDSHARHLASAFTDQALSRGLAGLVLWVESCPPFLDATGISAKCKDFHAKVQLWLSTQAKLKTVFLAGMWTNYASEVMEAVARDGARSADASAGRRGGSGPVGLTNTVKLLRSLNTDIVIVEDVPNFPVSPPYCAARARMFGRSDERCFQFPRKDVERSAEQASYALREASRHYGIPLVATAEAFCDGDLCRTQRDGVILYGDAHHLNTAGARYLGARLNIPWPGKSGWRTGTAALVERSAEP